MADHKLFHLLMDADASEEEIEELFQDLKQIFENPFDENIELAIGRGSTYVEEYSQDAN